MYTGLVSGWAGWSILEAVWSYEGVASAHIVLAGLLFAASYWYWTYWDDEPVLHFRAIAGDCGMLCLLGLLQLGFFDRLRGSLVRRDPQIV
jgi:hypothetical protein